MLGGERRSEVSIMDMGVYLEPEQESEDVSDVGKEPGVCCTLEVRAEVTA